MAAAAAAAFSLRRVMAFLCSCCSGVTIVEATLREGDAGGRRDVFVVVAGGGI